MGLDDNIKNYILSNISEEEAAYFNVVLQSCGAGYYGQNSFENITRQEQQLTVQPTELRSNPVYYRLYYVHLNTIFASLIPLVSLLYLNIATVKALKRMVEVRDTFSRFYVSTFISLNSFDFLGKTQRVKFVVILTRNSSQKICEIT